MSDIFENKGALAKTIVVAASDSLNQGQANYVCDGTNDEVEIQAALDALPATGGEVLLLDGTYNVEVTINLDSNQTLRGCGNNTILTTSTAALIFLSAIGGSGTEKVGIMIADLQIDGGAGNLGDCGIYFSYVDYSVIQNVYSRRNNTAGALLTGIYLEYSDFNNLIGNTVQGNHIGIYLNDNCTNNLISKNICQGNTLIGIQLNDNCTNNLISENICQGNTDEGIFLNNSCSKNIISGNIAWTHKFGIYIEGSSNYNIILGNISHGSNRTGFIISASDHNTIVGNLCFENSQENTNIYPDIYLVNADYNQIQGNTCRAGALESKPKYGIQIASGIGNYVVDNDLYNDGFGTAPFSDAGTGTKLNTYKVPFSDGSDPQDSGFLIDADTEFARAWLRLPVKVVQVVRIKVYARSVVTEADKMRGEFVVYGGADNEAYNIHDGSVANHPSSSSNFAANDVIYWTLTTAGVLALAGGDSIEVKVLYEAAANGDCATNAYLRTVEIEYV